MLASEIIDAAVQQVGTDASRATILSLLNEKYLEQVATARWYRNEVVIGQTTAGTSDYPITSDVVEAYGLDVAGSPYDPIGEDVIRSARASRVRISYSVGVFAQGYDATGNTVVKLYPTPDSGGADMTLYAARIPDALTESDEPITPRDSHPSLISGTAALILARIDEREDLAAPRLAEFDTKTEILRRRKLALMRGSSPAQMLVQGVHFR